MIIRSIHKNAIVLGAFALISIGLIAVFDQLTKDKIAAEMQAKFARTLNLLVSKDRYNNEVYHACTLISYKGETVKVYRMLKDDQNIAAIFSLITPKGYNGTIELIYGINADASIAGVRVIQHNETPGLGDKIEEKKSPWITQFAGLSLTNTPREAWQVKKDGGQFDAFTGATITPRAVLANIVDAQQFFIDNKTQIFAQPDNCASKNT